MKNVPRSAEIACANTRMWSAAQFATPHTSHAARTHARTHAEEGSAQHTSAASSPAVMRQARPGAHAVAQSAKLESGNERPLTWRIWRRVRTERSVARIGSSEWNHMNMFCVAIVWNQFA